MRADRVNERSALFEFLASPRGALLKRVAVVVFFLAVLWLLFDHARAIDWPAVWQSLRDYPLPTLAAGIAVALAAHAVCSGYDLIGRWHSGHALPAWLTAAIGFTSYAFNINLGSLVGGIALRYRLYTRFGLDAATVTDIVGISMLTNWMGYMGVAGVVFVLHPLALPPDWRIDSTGLRLVGVLLLCVVAAYLLLCRFASRRVWRLRGRELALPSARMAAVQVAVASTNWMLIASVVYVLLQQRIAYAEVLSVLLIAAVAGLIAHVPAGLGVIEAVFVALLSHRMPQAELLGGLLVYRAVYYLGPLALAAPLLLVLDRISALRQTACARRTPDTRRPSSSGILRSTHP
jgi:uncharacterized membrane protein YbhN (UPF0104 family)